jgi:hypothetical protein
VVKQNNAKLTEIEKAARDALQATAKDVLKVARKKAPKKEGDLRRSGRVLVDDVTVRVSFKDPASWLQHERLDYQHDEGEAKYLERAVDEVGVEADIISGVIARLR